MSKIEQAWALRKVIEQAVKTGNLSDEQRQSAKSLFPFWNSDGQYYGINEYVRYNDKLYRCVQPHDSQEEWNPEAAVSLWTLAADPNEEWPDWIQPTGAHNAYAKDSKVTHNGKRWTSNIDANVYEPPTQWTEVTS